VKRRNPERPAPSNHKVIQVLLGHMAVTTTQIYSHVSMDLTRNAAAALNVQTLVASGGKVVSKKRTPRKKATR
jgi:integrase